MATPTQPLQNQTQQAAPAAQPQQDAQTSPEPNAPDSSMAEDAVAGESINLQRAYSKLNSAITNLFDGLGIRRSATISHVAGESMASHIETVGNALLTVGGVSANILTASHTLHSPTGGETVAHPSDKLRETQIPKDSELAKAAINACKNFVSKVASLVGEEDPAVKLAKSQLALIGKNDMQGMSAFDAGASLLSVPGPLIQMVARLHSGTKENGHAPHLRAPRA